MALLAAETLDLGHRDALHADGGQRLTHFVKLERLDDGSNEFHECSPNWLKLFLSPRRPGPCNGGEMTDESEGLGHRQDGDATTGILRLATQGTGLVQRTGEAVELAAAARTIGIGTNIGQTNQPAAEILGHANFPVGVGNALRASGVVLVAAREQVTDVTIDTPTVTQIVVGVQFEIAGALGLRQIEIIADGVAVLRAQELVAGGNIQFSVVHGTAGVRSRMLGIGAGQRLGMGARIVVIDATNIDTNVAEGGAITTIEVHFQVTFGKARTRRNVRVPVTGVEAAGVGVIDTTLQRRLAESLVDTAETVAAGQRQVAGDGVRAGFVGHRNLHRTGCCESAKQCRGDQGFLHGVSPVKEN
ncbi:hypothetical protein SDC9_131510 [bioreactor metagenome]|uniref:Uncharacterized protein n=1 Tax=bioreactor metagenome TaxID=1076179 RepID=A0A645D5T5_9ZZZZ